LSKGERNSERAKTRLEERRNVPCFGLTHESPRALNWRGSVSERLGAGRGGRPRPQVPAMLTGEGVIGLSP
jgi:hypothetical protein